MTAVTQLGYLGLGVKSLDQWANYAEGTLGLERVQPVKGGQRRHHAPTAG